jgi:hypothetical protein
MLRPERDRTVQAIGERILLLPTLEKRWSDRLDFHDLAVWQLRQALEVAYEAGFRAARGVIEAQEE